MILESYAEVFAKQFTAGNSPHQLVQCSKVPSNNKNQHMMPFPHNKGLNKLQKPWTKILLVVNVGSLEKRSNQPKYNEPKTRSPKTTAKLIQNNVYCFFITIFRLAIPAFFRFTDVTELM